MKKLLTVIALAALFGYGKEKFGMALAGGSEEKTFSISGQVLQVDRANNTITIVHDRIPGLIQRSMENTYEMRGQNVLSLDLSGRTVFVSATLHKRGSTYWVTDVARR